MIEENNISNLIEKCKKGDPQAQKLLYEQFYGPLMNICLRYSPDYETARDWLNESFSKIFLRLKKLKHHEAFISWAKKITLHICLDYLKKRKAEILSISEIEEENFVIEYDTGKWEVAHLLQLIQKLPSQTRAVFNLYVMEGYSHKEISKMLGISQNTSFWHLNHARKLLKQWITESENEG